MYLTPRPPFRSYTVDKTAQGLKRVDIVCVPTGQYAPVKRSSFGGGLKGSCRFCTMLPRVSHPSGSKVGLEPHLQHCTRAFSVDVGVWARPGLHLVFSSSTATLPDSYEWDDTTVEKDTVLPGSSTSS